MKISNLYFVLFAISLNGLYSQAPGTEIVHPMIHFQIDTIPDPLPDTYVAQPGWKAGVNSLGDFEITESAVVNGVSVRFLQGPIYAKRSDGYVGLGFGLFAPTADVEIRQNSGPVTSRGLKLTAGSNSWNMLVNDVGNLVFHDPAGDLRAWITEGAGSFIITSDERLKENFASPLSVLQKIEKLNPLWYNYKAHDKRIFGFVAQEVEKVFPEFVETSPTGIKGINYDAFGPLAIQAIKEQEVKIKELQLQLLRYKNLEARIAALEN